MTCRPRGNWAGWPSVASASPPPGWQNDRPGRHAWGAFDSTGRLVAKAADREQGHWFGSRLVPASGVAGVAVSPELRGSGLARQLLTTLLVDASAAIAARGWPPHLYGSVDLSLEDGVCPWNAGTHRLVLAAGTGRLEPGGRAEVTLTARGLAVLYAGAATPSLPRRAGLLAGGDEVSDVFLQAATAGPSPALLDYF